MSSGAVDSRLVALLVIIVLGCRVSGMEAEDLCQQFKSGRATIALLTPTRDGKILLLDDHFRGYLVPEDHFHIARGIASHIEPSWLNLTAQSPIQVDVGQKTPPPINGRGVFYFTKRNIMNENEAYLGVLWSNLTTATIVPFDPPGPAAHYNCQMDDYLTDRVIPNVFFSQTYYFGTEILRPSFTRDSLHGVIPHILPPDRLVIFSPALYIHRSFNLTTIDGGFIGNDLCASYGFSNCAKAILNLRFMKTKNKKRNALRLADFILCSATDQPPTSYRPEAKIVPAKCYHPEAEPTAIPTATVLTEETRRISLTTAVVILAILLLATGVACFSCFGCDTKLFPAGNSRGNSPTTSLTSLRTKSGGGDG